MKVNSSTKKPQAKSKITVTTESSTLSKLIKRYKSQEVYQIASKRATTTTKKMTIKNDSSSVNKILNQTIKQDISSRLDSSGLKRVENTNTCKPCEPNAGKPSQQNKTPIEGYKASNPKLSQGNTSQPNIHMKIINDESIQELDTEENSKIFLNCLHSHRRTSCRRDKILNCPY